MHLVYNLYITFYKGGKTHTWTEVLQHWNKVKCQKKSARTDNHPNHHFCTLMGHGPISFSILRMEFSLFK